MSRMTDMDSLVFNIRKREEKCDFPIIGMSEEEILEKIQANQKKFLISRYAGKTAGIRKTIDFFVFPA